MGDGRRRRWEFVREDDGDSVGMHVVLTAEPWEGGRIGWVDFVAYEVLGHWEGTETIIYQRKDWDMSPDPVESLDDAAELFSGFIKWDGCNEVAWGEQSHHACSLDQREALNEALMEVLRTSAVIMGNAWDHDTPESSLPVEEIHTKRSPG